MKKVLQIGGNLRTNGISSLIMGNYRQLNSKYEFIFVNTAKEDGILKNEVEELGGKVVSSYVNGRGLFRALSQARKIRKIIQKEKPDVVHSHYYSNNGLYLRQAWLEKVPVKVASCHQQGKKISFGKRIAKTCSQIMVNKYADEKLSSSKPAADFFYGKTPNQVVNCSIDYGRFHILNGSRNEICNKWELNPNQHYLIFVGRMAKQKNPFFLLDLMESLKKQNITLLCITYGKLFKKFQKGIQKKGLNNIKFFPSNCAYEELMNICDFLVLPSLHEGFGIVLLEAQACGLPCLASKNVPVAAQRGMVTYLELKTSAWKKEILGNMNKRKKGIYKQNEEDLMENNSQFMDLIYSNPSDEEWVQFGRELSLGSKRFYRNKYLSTKCFEHGFVKGEVKGTFYYALALFEGNGITKNQVEAQKIVKKIVSKIEKLSASDDKCLTILGDMYSFGLGKTQNFEKAFEIYSQAAEKNNLEAMCDLGYMYLVGQGCSIDKEKSSYWWKKSADGGYVHSTRDIGQLYLSENKISEAKKYLQLASENNYSHGTTDLAFLLLEEDPEANKKEVINLLSLALKQDKERTFRDLVAHHISYEALINQNELVFEEKTQLTEITSENTYGNCVYLSSKVDSVEAGCFYHHHQVSKIFVEKENPVFCSKNGVLFSKDLKTLVRYPIGLTNESFEVPESVEVIGPHAFQNARNLRKVNLGCKILKIEDSAFDDCKNLIEINFPEGLQVIGPWAFHGCDKLKRISLPASIIEIGTYAFGSQESLKSIEIDKECKNYASVDGVLFDKALSTLIQYPAGYERRKYKVPETVKTLEFRCFSDNTHLKIINCQNVSKIGKKAFYCCYNLKKVLFNDRFLENQVAETLELHKTLKEGL